MAPTYPNHGRIDGPIVIIGFGSIGQGHAAADRAALHLRPAPGARHRARRTSTGPSSSSAACTSSTTAVTRENYRALLTQLFPDGRGFCVNLSVDTSSLDLMRLCRELGVLYIDTVVEPWAGHYFDLSLDPGRPHQLRAARGDAGREAGATPAAPPRSPAAAPTPAWCRGS